MFTNSKKSFMKFKHIFLLSFISTILIYSCKKEEASEAVRLFRPPTGQMSTLNNSIAVQWQDIKGASSYILQVSRDTFKTIDYSFNLDTNAFVVPNLKWNQAYQLQVKAVAEDTTLNSRWSNLGSIKIPKFLTWNHQEPKAEQSTDEAIRVNWINSGATVTSIKILKASDSSLVREVGITSSDITNQYKIITGLTGATSYVVFLYSGTADRGWENYTTKAPEKNPIDLRNITGRPSVLADTISTIPSGSTVLLKRGETYQIASAINLNKSVIIKSGSDLLVTSQAVVSMPANFNITSGATIDSIIFNDITLRGTDYASKYVFNISNACSIGKMSFESCRAEIFRGIVRTQSQPALIGTFQVRNSVLDSLAGYGVITIDVATSKVDNIIVQNSTIYKAEKFITSKNNSNSIAVENCTFNEVPRGDNYLIDYQNATGDIKNVTSPIKITNSLFGIGKSNSGNRSVRGTRVGSNTTIDVSNSFKTSDQTVTSNELPNLSIYTGTITSLWQDPENGNFKIKDNSFSARSTTGDPRWRP
jgi:hypothetical protein